jgi:perosamine synthetase
MTNFIMQMRPLFGEEEKKAICDYMDEDGFITEFRHTEEFENQIAKFTGSKHCIVVNNGTISLALAGLALGLKAGDEVIVPNYTMIATPNSQKLFGATPVFVDVEPSTLCMDIEKVRNAISNKTKAIILVSANGRSPDSGIEAFEKLSKEKGIPIIEDAAQSLGSFFPDGRHIGRAGVIGSFSFSAPKIISTGQGGALITDDDQIASNIRKLKDFGRSSGGNDVHDTIGFNFKFTELQAVIGLEQMKKLESRVIRKKEIYQKYCSLLKELNSITLYENNVDTTAPWFIDCKAEDRDLLVEYLKKRGIGSRVMYPPINEQKAYNVLGHFPVSKEVGEKGLWLPSMVQLKDSEVVKICRHIKEFYHGK